MNRYPTNEELEKITKWSWKDSRACFDYIASIWEYSDYVTFDKGECHLSTGGWSGNEDIIGALKENTMIWMFTWMQSRRGGHYIFDMERTYG